MDGDAEKIQILSTLYPYDELKDVRLVNGTIILDPNNQSDVDWYNDD